MILLYSKTLINILKPRGTKYRVLSLVLCKTNSALSFFYFLYYENYVVDIFKYKKRWWILKNSDTDVIVKKKNNKMKIMKIMLEKKIENENKTQVW